MVMGSEGDAATGCILTVGATAVAANMRRHVCPRHRGFITPKQSISTLGKAASGAEGGEWWQLTAENLEESALHLPEQLGETGWVVQVRE